MRIWVNVGSLLTALAVSACAEDPQHLNTHWLDYHATQNPTLTAFTVCHGFGCTQKSSASLSEGQWRRVTAVFKPRAKTAEGERQQVGRAVAMIETLVGPQTGTAAHQWTHHDKMILPNLGDQSQLDCVDEAVNTWTYMTMLERGGLLHFHKVADLSYGGTLTGADLRNTAVLQEIKGGYFAVDASLVDGGAPPVIMPLATWLSKWPPDLPEDRPRQAKG